jgi:hypothetical protein
MMMEKAPKSPEAKSRIMDSIEGKEFEAPGVMNQRAFDPVIQIPNPYQNTMKAEAQIVGATTRIKGKGKW